MAVDGFCGASLRITGVYGPAGLGLEHKWEGLFRDYLAGRPIEPRAGTEVHGDDVAAAVRLILEAPAARVCGEVFNVSDMLVDRRAILSIVQDAAGSPHPLPPTARSLRVELNVSGENKRAWLAPGRRSLVSEVRPVARSRSIAGHEALRDTRHSSGLPAISRSRERDAAMSELAPQPCRSAMARRRVCGPIRPARRLCGSRRVRRRAAPGGARPGIALSGLL